MKLVKNTFDLFTKPIIKVSEGIRTNKKSIPGYISDWFKGMKGEFRLLGPKLRDLKKTNFDLGVYHYNNGHVKDSAFRFNFLRIFFSDIPDEVYYYLGRSYFEQGSLKKAKSFLEQYLNKNTKNFEEEAKYTLQILNDDVNNVKNIPNSIVSHQFNLLSSIYNDIYIVDNHDCIQNFIIQNIKQILSDLGQPFGNKFLDLGCGTGYIGKKLKDSKATTQSTGVDISPKMSKLSLSLKSDDLKVYEKIVNTDVIAFLKSNKDSYNLIVCSQLLNHVYDWRNLLKLSIAALEKNGILAFTFKVYGNDTGSYFDRYKEEFLHSGEEIMNELKNLKDINILLSKPLSFEIEDDSGLIIIRKK